MLVLVLLVMRSCPVPVTRRRFSNDLGDKMVLQLQTWEMYVLFLACQYHVLCAMLFLSKMISTDISVHQSCGFSARSVAAAADIDSKHKGV